MAQIELANYTKKQTSASLSNNKKKWFIPILIILLIMIGVATGRQMGGQSMSEQRQMQQYLEDKYGEEFVVKEPIRKAGGLGIEGFLESEAYPVKDNSLIFPIRMASTFKNDEYAGVLWQREESKRIEPESRRIFGEDVSLGIEIKTTGTSRGDINIVGNVSDFNTATNKYGKKYFIL